MKYFQLYFQYIFHMPLFKESSQQIGHIYYNLRDEFVSSCIGYLAKVFLQTRKWTGLSMQYLSEARYLVTESILY